MKKHYKIVLALILTIVLIVPHFNSFAGSHNGSNNAVIRTWDDYYNYLVDLNYRKTQFADSNLRKQYLRVRSWLSNVTRLFTNEPYSGSHGGDGHSRETAVEVTEDPVVTPKPIATTDNRVYNPVTNNYEDIYYIYDDYSYNDNSVNVISYETTNNYITYEFNYTYYDIVVSPKDSPTEGKFFKVYYELPDGRSSYNLTPNDIKGVIFNYDVVNYVRTITDEDVLGIWHLDGDFVNSVDNVSWYNNTTTFTDGRFGGCINMLPNYTDRNSPNKINLVVSNVDTIPTDWTLEFWMYIPNVSSTIYTYGNDMYESIASFNYLVPEGWHSVAITSEHTVYIDGDIATSQLDFTNDYLMQINPPSFTYKNAVSMFTSLGNLFITFSPVAYSHNTRILNGATIHQVYYGQYFVDEIKFTKEVLYDPNTWHYYPRYEPYDLNFAYTIPSTPDTSTIAIQSPTDVHNIQIGGVRSSEPVNGDVFISLYDGRATGISQYYNGVWNNVNGAVYFDGEWKDLYQYDFNSMMLVNDEEKNTGATYIINYYGDTTNYVDISGDDITFTIDTTDSNPQDIIKILKWIPLLFGAVGTILGTLVPFLPTWLTGLIAMCLGAVLTLILFVFIRRK